MAITNELRDAINAMKKGEAEGFSKMYDATHDYVYAKAKYIMKSEQDALDLTQETYIQAYKGIASLEDANNVYAWLGGIVYRQGMRIFGKKKELLTGENQENIFDEVVAKDATPEEAADQQATVDIVKGMIAELPELQRVAVLSFYYDNMKIEDIAQLCDCSANTIKSRLNYAKKYLKTKVEAHERHNRYKLCSLSPAVLLLAFKGLFAEAEYKMPAYAVRKVYVAACARAGVKAAPLSAMQASAATQAYASAVAGATASAAKTGLAMKIAAIAAAIAVTGGVATVVAHNRNSQPKQPVTIELESEDSQQEDVTEEKDETAEVEEIIDSEAITVEETEVIEETTEEATEAEEMEAPSESQSSQKPESSSESKPEEPASTSNWYDSYAKDCWIDMGDYFFYICTTKQYVSSDSSVFDTLISRFGGENTPAEYGFSCQYYNEELGMVGTRSSNGCSANYWTAAMYNEGKSNQVSIWVYRYCYMKYDYDPNVIYDEATIDQMRYSEIVYPPVNYLW